MTDLALPRRIRRIAPSERGRREVLRAAAAILSRRPFAATSIDDVVEASGLPFAYVASHFSSMHELGSAILDHERASMKRVQDAIAKADGDPLDRLTAAFNGVGENLMSDVVVRAGVRIAAESKEFFPERRLDPYATWEAFVMQQLTEAQAQRLVRAHVDIPDATWAIVHAGLGVTSRIVAEQRWDEAGVLLSRTIHSSIALIVPPRGAR